MREGGAKRRSAPENRPQQRVVREDLGTPAEEQHRDVVQGRGQAQQSRVGVLHLRGRPAGPGRGRREVAQVRGLHLVQPQGPRQRGEHGLRDRRLPALFQPAVVVGAQARQHGQFLPAQAGHAPWTGERLDAGLAGSEPVPAGPQERAEGGAVSTHAPTVRPPVAVQPGHAVPRQRSRWQAHRGACAMTP